MIRKLTEADREISLAFVAPKPAENLFIIGDIEAFGFDEDFQDVWGDFADDGQLRGVLLRYRVNFIVYAPENYDAEGFAAIVENDRQPKKLVSGISEVVQPLVEKLTTQPDKTRELYYAKCEALNMLDTPAVDVKRASVEDAPRISALHRQIPEFDNADDGGDESIRKNMESGVSRTFFVEDGDEMVTTAMTTAENSFAAMVIGVATLKGYEKRGYATACMQQLCGELLDEGRQLCLFYDNPAAGNIYKRLGFEDIDRWVMNTFERKPAEV